MDGVRAVAYHLFLRRHSVYGLSRIRDIMFFVNSTFFLKVLACWGEYVILKGRNKRREVLFWRHPYDQCWNGGMKNGGCDKAASHSDRTRRWLSL